MTSLRGRLLIWLLGLLTAVGLLAGTIAYVLDRSEVDENLDSQLRRIASNFGDVPPLASAETDVTDSPDPEDEFVVTIWDESGKRYTSNPSLDMPRPVTEGFSNFASGGEDWRAYSGIDRGRTIQAAQREIVRQEYAANSALRAILPFAILIPLSWLLVGWVVGRVLRPLHAVTSELHGWGKSSTSPLSLNGVPDEVAPLVEATNDLLARLHAQLEFRREFISDAAHELRTPLTALRLQMKNLGQATLSSSDASLVKDMEEGVRRMSGLVTQLLRLARADASSVPRQPSLCDLGNAVAGSLQDVVPVASGKDIDIGLDNSASHVILADPDELRILIANLVDNAVRYTPAGGAVDLAIEDNGTDIVLEIRDTGPGIPEELLDHVFDRFVRIAGSDQEGSGLGLPIVRAIADRNGARVTLANRKDRSGIVARVAFAVAS